jgi:predicted nucleic acid-binding protein
VTPIILDTGVLVKVFVREEDSWRATKLLQAAAEGTYRLVAPDFMAVELGNVLWKLVHRTHLREAEARQALGEFPFDRIEWLPARVLLAEAFGIAIEHEVSVYDAAFLAAAASLGADLVTADEELHRKVASRLPWVRLLRDFEGV